MLASPLSKPLVHMCCEFREQRVLFHSAGAAEELTPGSLQKFIGKQAMRRQSRVCDYTWVLQDPGKRHRQLLHWWCSANHTQGFPEHCTWTAGCGRVVLHLRTSPEWSTQQKNPVRSLVSPTRAVSGDLNNAGTLLTVRNCREAKGKHPTLVIYVKPRLQGRSKLLYPTMLLILLYSLILFKCPWSPASPQHML